MSFLHDSHSLFFQKVYCLYNDSSETIASWMVDAIAVAVVNAADQRLL